MNTWRCDVCGTATPGPGLILCAWCRRVELEAEGDLSIDAMYEAAVRLLVSVYPTG